jgi:hypothetical protein
MACSSSEEPELRTVVGFSTEGFTSTEPVRHVVIRVSRGSEVQTVETSLPTQKTEVNVQGTGQVTVELEGYTDASKTERRWVQRASAPLNRKPGDTRLLRLGFDPLCVSDRPESVLLTCGPGTTCARGVCIGMERSSIELERYVPDWFVPSADACRMQSVQGEVTIGAGAAAYQDLAEDATLALEPGPQGGHHLWLAAKSRNFAQQGTLVAITGRNLQSGVQASPASFLFSLTPVGDGSCSLAGLRYQVDAGGIDYRAFLGGPFEISIEMRDKFGTIARAVKRVQIGN